MKESKFTKLLRFKQFFLKKRLSIIAKLLDYIFRTIFSNDIPASVQIGKGTKFAHSGLGCIIHPNVIIGDGCKIFQNVTISVNEDKNPPRIGDNVYIGTGAIILGDIKIGNNVKIGANAVVMEDVEDGITILGIYTKSY